MTATRRIAVIVNRNAHQVTAGRISALERRVGAGSLFVTGSLAEARSAVEAVVAGGFDVLCTAGGDGTFVQALNDLHDLSARGGLPAERTPILFALRFGLGNAIADLCNSSGKDPAGLARDLAWLARSGTPVELPLVRANGRVAYYAGVGADADFVEDLYSVAKGPPRRGGALFRGRSGILLTALSRTIPRLIREPRFAFTVRVAGGAAWRLDGDGRVEGEARPAPTVLFDGQGSIAAGGTIPSYGRGFTFFPFARSVPRGTFHLRVWCIDAKNALFHLPRIWTGKYRNPDHVIDFAASDVMIEWPEPRPIHIGGDLCDATRSLHIEMLPWSVRILERRDA